MSVFKKQPELLTVKEIREALDWKVSIRHIYNLIDRGELQPVYRMAGSRGTCVPREVVLAYKQSRIVDVNA